MDAILTDHAEKRVRDRVGVKKNVVDKVTQKALKNGITHNETAGSLKRYMDKLYLSHKKATNMRIYNRNIYLFDDNILITVINLPNKYHSTVDKINRKKRARYDETLHLS